VLPPPRGMAKELETYHDPLVFEFDDKAARSRYLALPEFLQKAIARSPEYQEKFGAPGPHLVRGGPPDDDDIPF